MDIEIKDYLNQEEIKEICKDALYQKIREDMRNLNVNDIIANISYAHPRKTRQSEFLNLFPDADLSTGTVNVCPNSLYAGKCDCTRYQNCLSCKREFWSQEVE